MATRIQVVFYSMYGHVYRLAEAVSAGARYVAGTEVSVYQVPELVPDDILEKRKRLCDGSEKPAKPRGLSRVACVPHGFIPVSALPMSQRCYRTMSYVSTAVRLTLL
jgi:hypothetical protein